MLKKKMPTTDRLPTTGNGDVQINTAVNFNVGLSRSIADDRDQAN